MYNRLDYQQQMVIDILMHYHYHLPRLGFRENGKEFKSAQDTESFVAKSYDETVVSAVLQRIFKYKDYPVDDVLVEIRDEYAAYLSTNEVLSQNNIYIARKFVDLTDELLAAI